MKSYKISIVVIHKGEINPLLLTLRSIENRIGIDKLSFFEVILIFSGVELDYRKIVNDFLFIKKTALNIDKSIYNAMNIGIYIATGKSIIFINSGDILLNDPSIDFIEGTSIMYNYVVSSCNINGEVRISKSPLALCHQSFLAPIEADHQDRIYYDESEMIYADSFWMNQNILRYGVKRSDLVCSLFWIDGVSAATKLITAIKNLIYSSLKIQASKLILKSVISKLITKKYFILFLIKIKYKKTNFRINYTENNIICKNCGEINIININKFSINYYDFQIFCKKCVASIL